MSCCVFVPQARALLLKAGLVSLVLIRTRRRRPNPSGRQAGVFRRKNVAENTHWWIKVCVPALHVAKRLKLFKKTISTFERQIKCNLAGDFSRSNYIKKRQSGNKLCPFFCVCGRIVNSSIHKHSLDVWAELWLSTLVSHDGRGLRSKAYFSLPPFAGCGKWIMWNPEQRGFTHSELFPLAPSTDPHSLSGGWLCGCLAVNPNSGRRWVVFVPALIRPAACGGGIWRTVWL